MLEKILSVDPQFAEAYAVLAQVYAVLPFYTTDDRLLTHAKARVAAEHALALNPELAEAYGALGDVAILSMNYALAEALLERSRALGSSFPDRRLLAGIDEPGHGTPGHRARKL